MVASSISFHRASSVSSPASVSRSGASAWSRAARTWSRVPPRSPRRLAAARIRRTLSARSSSPRCPSIPRRSRSRSAARKRAARRARRAELVERRTDVVRRRERVGPPAPRAVAEPAGRHGQAPYTARPSTAALSIRRVRCRPSRTSSTAAATSPAAGVVAVPEPVEHLGQARHRADLVEQVTRRAPAHRSRRSRPPRRGR